MNNKSTLLAGPWIGELGWSLCCWQGHLRWLKNNELYNRVIVMAKAGTEPIYSDFCDQFIEHNPTIENTSGPINTGYFYGMEHLNYMNKNTEWLCPFKMPFHVMYDPENRNLITKTFWQQEFISYKKQVIKKNYILIHARDTNKWGSKNRNWSHENWDKLIETIQIYAPDTTIISIGTTKAAYHTKNTIDKRDISLTDLITLMSESKLIIGTSSGPMHLSSMCELPHLVISSPHNIIRYEKDWNPFSIPVYMATEYNWNPPHEYILECFKEFDRKLTK